MCNRYEQKGNANEIRSLARSLGRELATTSSTDNLPPQDSVYPDQDAPILRSLPDGRLELVMARWGFPPIPGRRDVITNIRNLKSRWWRENNREWINSPEHRCLVPFTAFAEPVRDSKWFVVPGFELVCFAGVWRPWHGERLAKQPGKKRRAREKRDWQLFSFLTTEANDIVSPVHDKAMPVVLINSDEQNEWLASSKSSFRLQRPLSNERLIDRTPTRPRHS